MADPLRLPRLLDPGDDRADPRRTARRDPRRAGRRLGDRLGAASLPRRAHASQHGGAGHGLAHLLRPDAGGGGCPALP